jgi:hypothetical protein
MLDLGKEYIDHLQHDVTSKQLRLMLYKVGFRTNPSSTATGATPTMTSGHLHHGIESIAPRLRLHQRIVPHIRDAYEMGLNGLYSVGKGLEIVSLEGV